MAKIGTFTKNGDVFTGTLTTLTISADLIIEPVVNKRSENAPDYRVFFREVEIGAAWKRTSKEGSEYLSVSIDDPVFADKLSCRLVKSANDSSHALYWDRERAKE